VKGERKLAEDLEEYGDLLAGLEVLIRRTCGSRRGWGRVEVLEDEI